MALVCGPAMPSTVHAAGVVGTGTAASCTDPALDTALAGGGLVKFDCGPDPATIDISTGTGTKTIGADTTIDGGGAITISGGNAVGGFSVNSGVHFTVENLTIANGGGDRGTGISNDSATLTVTNSSFTDNSSCAGGGIVNIGGTVTVTNTTFSDNSAVRCCNDTEPPRCAQGSGGGIHNGFNQDGVAGTLTVTMSTFIDNHGAGIANDSSPFNPGGATLSVTDSTFTGNDGGIVNGFYSTTYSSGAPLTVTNCTFSGNTAYGIRSGGGTVAVTDSTFSGNVRSGIVNALAFGTAPAAGGTLTITNSTFTGHTQVDVLNENGTVTVTNSTFTNNSGNGPATAGSIFNEYGMLTVASSTITGNSGSGYAIDNFSGSAVMRNTIIANNRNHNCRGTIIDGRRAIMDGGHNLEDGTTCGFSAANGSLSDTDPQLDPAGLQDNGGQTDTVALCTAVGVPVGCTAASPAIDAGDQAACNEELVSNLDQRGFARPGADHSQCSIGAYEADATVSEGCVGDCNDSSGVTVDELVRGVKMLLNDAALDQCQAFDCNGSGHVTVDCLVRAANSALRGCGAVCSSGAVCDATVGSG